MKSESYIKLNRQELYTRLYPGYPAQTDNLLAFFIKKTIFKNKLLEKLDLNYREYSYIPLWKRLFGISPKKLPFKEWVIPQLNNYYFRFDEEAISFRHLYNLYNNSKDYIYFSSEHLNELIYLECQTYSDINIVTLSDDHQFVLDSIINKYRFKNIK